MLHSSSEPRGMKESWKAMVKIPRVAIVAADDKGGGLQGEFSTLSVGLGLHRAWTYLALFCSTSVLTSPALISSQTYSVDLGLFYVICVLFTIAVLVCIAAFSSRLRKFLLEEKTSVFAAVLCTLGSVVALLAQLSPSLAFILSLIAGILCGISNALLIMFWGMCYARFEVMTIVINTAISIIIALMLFAFIAFAIPSPWSALLTSLLPLLELPFIRKHLHSKEEKMSELPRPSYLPTNKRSLSLRLAIPLLLFGYTLGVLRYFTVHAVNVHSNITFFLLALFAASIIMVCLLVILYYYAESQSGESLVRYLTPILICGMLFLVLPTVTGSTVTSVLLMTCYLCFKAMVWIFLCGTCSKFRLSPFFVVGLGFGAMSAGSFLANLSLIANDALVRITPFGENTILAIAVIAMVVAYALLPRANDIARYAAEAASSEVDKARIRKMSKRTHTDKRDSAPAIAIAESPASADIASSAASTASTNAQTPPARKNRSARQGAENAKEIKVNDITKDAHIDERTSASSEHATPVTAATSTGSTAAIASTGSEARVASVASGASGDVAQPAIVVTPSPQDTASELAPSDAFRAKCDEISNRYLLSKRERDVMYLLARGHNASYIQEKLFVAQSTTKTHIYHIYKKLEIHSQQELIAMIMDELEE